jgi:hypothetical protein
MLSVTDFVRGNDITGIVTPNGGDFNNLVDLAAPISDSVLEGKGIILYTKDSLPDTPIVPDAGTNVKWKRYLWMRIPYFSVANQTPKIYGWSDNGPLDPTLLAWQQIVVDTTSFEAEIAAVLSIANSALASANAAAITASNANVNAASAITAANAANTTAGNAATLAATANTNAAAAQSTADAAATAAAAALVAAGARRDVATALNPGTSRQLIRTNLGATAVEWFNQKDTYVKIIEKQNSNVGAGDAANGVNLRDLNTEEYDTGALAAIAASKVTMKAGTYKFTIKCPAHTRKDSQAFLIKDSDNSILLQGTSEGRIGGDSGVKSYSVIDGIITFAVDTIVRVDHYWAAAGEVDSLGHASGVGPAGQYEVYTVFEAWLLG